MRITKGYDATPRGGHYSRENSYVQNNIGGHYKSAEVLYAPNTTRNKVIAEIKQRIGLDSKLI